jgi:hypothetical protein
MISRSLPVLTFAVALAFALTLASSPAEEGAPSLQAQVAADYKDAESRLTSLEERLAASLDAAKRAEFDSVRQKWNAYRDASVAMTLSILQPKAELSEYFRYL